jgi:MrcB-like, N-terminal domain/Domain of unknown function (DUF3883)
MPKLDDVLQRILDLAPLYSLGPSPAMRERDALSAQLRSLLLGVLSSKPELAALDLRATIGGHQGSYGPVPWVRVFSQRRSPSATAGIYLAYLFAADGSRAYLSVQQGSSELRSGRMRPVNDAARLRASGANARGSIRELIESPLGAGLAIEMDLAAAQAPVKQYARQRITNYEHANILAIRYDSREIPPEDALLEDFARMLTLLLALYGDLKREDNAAARPGADSETESIGAEHLNRVQELLRDAAVRRAVELHAEDSAVEHFTKQGWTVERVGHLKLGYDLECRDSLGQSLHVEVKGTQSSAEEVFLTRNEVFHLSADAACPSQHALYVLSEIMLSSTGEIDRKSGRRTRLLPWTIDTSLLTPTAYAYRVPHSPAD